MDRSELLSVASRELPADALLASEDGFEVFTFWSLEEAYPSGRLRYHLGQLCMLQTINHLVDSGNAVQAVFCDPDFLTYRFGEVRPMHDDLGAGRRFIELLADGAVEVRRMSELIRQKVGSESSRFSELSAEVLLASQRFRAAMRAVSPPGRAAERELVRYRRYQPDATPSKVLTRIWSHLERTFDLPACLLLPSAYAFWARPKWFEAAWLADFASCLADEGGRNDRLLLLEADRNAYAWLVLECLFRIARGAKPGFDDWARWPDLVLLRSAPALDGDGPMMLSRRDGCLFVDSTAEEVAARIGAAPASVQLEYNRLFLDGQSLIDVKTTEWESAFVDRFRAWQRKAAELLRRSGGVPGTGRAAAPRAVAPTASPLAAGGARDAPPDVFLCYNRRDQDAVKQVRSGLESRGIRTWMDVYDTRPGQRWQKELEALIDSIGSAAVFVGPQGISPFQSHEIDALLRELSDRRRPIIPVILLGFEGEPELPRFLEAHGWVDFRVSDPDPWLRLQFGITGRRPGSE